MPSPLELTGQRFGKLVALSKTDKRVNGKVQWLCRCDCVGVVLTVSSANLKNGNSKSCGCELGLKKKDTVSAVWQRRQITWSKLVRDRDGNKCVRCGQTQGRLDAHHLSDIDKADEEYYSIDVGVTLCLNCHMNFHGRYTRTAFTKEHFQEFLLLKELNIEK